MGQPGQRLSTTATGNVWGAVAKYLVVCSVYNVPTLFRNLIEVLTCKERDTLRTRYPLSSTVMLFV